MGGEGDRLEEKDLEVNPESLLTEDNLINVVEEIVYYFR